MTTLGSARMPARDRQARAAHTNTRAQARAHERADKQKQTVAAALTSAPSSRSRLKTSRRPFWAANMRPVTPSCGHDKPLIHPAPPPPPPRLSLAACRARGYRTRENLTIATARYFRDGLFRDGGVRGRAGVGPESQRSSVRAACGGVSGRWTRKCAA